MALWRADNLRRLTNRLQDTQSLKSHCRTPSRKKHTTQNVRYGKLIRLGLQLEAGNIGYRIQCVMPAVLGTTLNAVPNQDKEVQTMEIDEEKRVESLKIKFVGEDDERSISCPAGLDYRDISSYIAGVFRKQHRPLIKDERLRKALKMWADISEIEKVNYKLDKSRNICSAFFQDEACEVVEFGLENYYAGLEDGKTYTIEELCGDDDDDD